MKPRTLFLLIVLALCAEGLFLGCESDKADPSGPSGGGPTDTLIETFYMRDHENAEGRIYDLGVAEYWPTDSIISLHVYEAQPANPSARAAILRVNPQSPYEPFQVIANVRKLGSSEFIAGEEASANRRYVVFNVAHNQAALGYYMKFRRTTLSGPVTMEVGDTTGDTLILRMLRPDTGYAPDHLTWSQMWRNVYAVPQGQPVRHLNFKVFKGPPGSEHTPASEEFQQTDDGTQNYLTILGLDQFRPDGQRIPDSALDGRAEVYRPEWGLVIFPHRTPFDSDTTFTDTLQRESIPLEVRRPNLYNYTSLAEKTTGSAYFMRYERWTITPK